MRMFAQFIEMSYLYIRNKKSDTMKTIRPTGAIVNKTATHTVVKNGNNFDIYENGLDLEDGGMIYKPELIGTTKHKDDLFAIFEELAEEMRCLRNEF